MKYIINKTLELIKRNSPQIDGEAMIRVDGFEEIQFYEKLATELEKEFSETKIIVDIKLAKNKWNYFQKDLGLTSHFQNMLQHNWVASDESITRYRNLHKSNLLILLGTELEEDKGGLSNCYCITPDALVSELDGKYNEIFPYFDTFSDSDKEIVNKLYRDLFSFVPVDIIKLSNIADKLEFNVSNIGEFIDYFYKNLPDWGLPKRLNHLPSNRDLKSKKNILELEYKFISRNLFKKMTNKQYENYKKKLEKYTEDEGEYCSTWFGWQNQETIHSYSEFSKILLEFSRGENAEENKNKLIRTDFDIISSVLDIKLDKTQLQKDKGIILIGNPLKVFTTSLLHTLFKIKDEFEEYNVSKIVLEVTDAEIITNYSNLDDEDSEEALLEAWKTVCRSVNGIITLLNKHSWIIKDVDIDIELSDKSIFLPEEALSNIKKGFIKAANSNKTINKIFFKTKCCDSDNIFVPNFKIDFLWEFSESSSWLYDFSDICNKTEIDINSSYIPISSISNLPSLIFAKSEDEFFDLFNEGNITFDFNLIDSIHKKNNGNSEIEKYKTSFIKIGNAFAKFLIEVKNNGFYSTLGKDSDSEIIKLISEYTSLGELLLKNSFPENLIWILDSFIHAFNIEEDVSSVTEERDLKCCIVPPWHPVTLQKLNDQVVFFLDGCEEWWNEINTNQQTCKYHKYEMFSMINNLINMSMLQSSLDIFPSSGQQYFSSIASYGLYSLYACNDLKNTSRLKDIIRKDAIFDDDFVPGEMSQMNDNAEMIYSIIQNYIKAFEKQSNFNLVFINPVELQPIVAAVYKYIENVQKTTSNDININLKILVKPENKGGRNYLNFWMNEFFSQDSNVNIKTYLNEYSSSSDLEKLLNGNNDIVFIMDLLLANNYQFIKDSSKSVYTTSDCRFPIVYKPSPVSGSTIKRKIELSQPQFKASYLHTQVVRYRKNLEDKPDSNYIAVKEVCIDKNIQNMIYDLHSKAYWVVCIDRCIDGDLLRKDNEHGNDYSIIGFSTGKGAYAQYNVTVTARKSIRDSIRDKLSRRLYQLFKWDSKKIEEAANICINEAGKLDGISLFSAINLKDNNINEFMAYVLTSLYEKKNSDNCALKIMIHLDSYKHWFDNNIEQDKSKSRPDFLLLEVKNVDDSKLLLNATVIECKIAKFENCCDHLNKAIDQVKHGIERLKRVFNPNSKSVKRRYWYAQLYRALAFAQVTFNNDSKEFEKLSVKLRSILDANFEIDWKGKVLGYWVDSNENCILPQKIEDENENIIRVDIPQKVIQGLLLGSEDNLEYVNISESELTTEEEQDMAINEREKELIAELKQIQKGIFDKEKDKELSMFEKEEGVKESKNDEVRDKEVESKFTPIKQESRDDSFKALSETLDFEKVLIGKDKYQNTIDWEFGNPQLSNRHLLITGVSGSGKTYAIQTLLYEISKFNVSSIVFDYTEGFRKNQLESAFIEKMGNKIKEHIVYYSGVPINPFKKHLIDVADNIIPEKTSDVASRFSNILKHVYKFGDQQYSAIFNATFNGIEKYGDEMDIQYFQEMLEEEKISNKTAQSVISKMTPFFLSIDFNSDKSFSWENILYSDEAQLNIFQLTNIDRETQVIITELMLWDAWYYTKQKGNKNKPFVVVLDEAQNLSHKQNSPSAAILTEGRKFGWSAWFATQSLKILKDDEIIRLLQASTKLYFKPTDEEIKKISKQLDPTDGDIWLAPLNNLKKGQCIVVGDRTGLNGKFGSTKPTITNVTQFEDRG